MLNTSFPTSEASTIFTWPGYSEVYNSESNTEDLVKAAQNAVAHLKGVGVGVWAVKPHADTLLESMLNHGVDENARRYTACVILTAWKKNLLFLVAEIWFQYLLYPVQAVGALRTEIPKHLPNIGYQDVGSLILEARRGNQEAFERVILLRDDHHCIASNVMDKRMRTTGEPTASVVATHILPFSLAQLLDRDETHHKPQDKTLTGNLMKYWGSLDITARIEIAINDISNAMLLSLDDHIMFRSFMWYLEPVENERNIYNVQTIPGINIAIKGNKVAFADKSGRGIPLPDPRYLAVHAAFAKVLYSSGVGKYFFQSEEKEVESAREYYNTPRLRSRSSTL